MSNEGLLVVDKPAGWTSHDVVARIRRLAGTRRVGHAGTLDPMATGVLVVGVGRATRLLGYLALTEKAYDATIRLGQATSTDDAEGELLAVRPAGELNDARIRAATADLTGALMQVPSSVSAIKVGGRRSYARVRAGEQVDLPARPVQVRSFDVRAVRRPPPSGPADCVDVDVSVVCSSGTYVRALARDLGAALGVGGHLSGLRRTRVGPYRLADSRTLPELELSFSVLCLAEVVAAAFPRRDVDSEAAGRLAHGAALPAAGFGPGPVAVFGPEGDLVALVEERDGRTRVLAGFAG